MKDASMLSAVKTLQYGVYVVSSKWGSQLGGLTASWVSQVCHEPPLIAVVVSKNSNTHRLIKESGCFAVNVLRVDQKDLAKFFSSSKKDKFTVMPYKEEKSGAPILKEAYAYLDCKVWKEVECGDHTMFIGEVLKGAVEKEGETLTTRDLESTYVG